MVDSGLRLYRDLAWLWPLWGDPSNYAPWCDAAAQLIRQYSSIEARTVLNMACGGGKNAFNLKRHFEVTGIDASTQMLDNASKLNPECTFIQADMLACSLGRQFDCVFVDDAVEGMAQPELAAVFQTAFCHLRSGGVMVVSPGTAIAREDFEQNATRITHARSRLKPDNIEVVFIENNYDPDPTDDTYEFTIVYLIRQDGKLRVEVDRETETFVSLDVWRATIREAGFEIHDGSFTEDDKPYLLLACVKPLQ
ncbi:MAG: class I SAM-dependent methyltransferase [Armatimonadota bacterium]